MDVDGFDAVAAEASAAARRSDDVGLVTTDVGLDGGTVGADAGEKAAAATAPTGAPAAVAAATPGGTEAFRGEVRLRGGGLSFVKESFS